MSSDTSPTAVEAAVESLRDHPWISTARTDGTGGVRLTPAESALTSAPEPGALVTEFLDHWGELYDWTYTEAGARHSADLDLSGWRASDTGLPFPVAHMRQWVDHAVRLVLETSPELVLELGCGTGLLAHRLRDRVAGYVGTDVAPAAVDTLNREAHPGTAFVRAAAHEAGADHVRAALESVSGPAARPDCVVLNSVTQCFPDLGYLRAVLHGAIDLVRPGGTVVVGDVRHAGLLVEYCRWVERSVAPDAPPEVIEERAALRAVRDDELLFDPAALASLARESPRRVRMGVRAKTMTEATELTRYRFDAVLTVDAPEPAEVPTVVTWPDLPAEADALARVRALTEGASAVLVAEVPNGALVPDAPGAAELDRLVGSRGCVALDAANPWKLGVASPRSVATRPVTEPSGQGQAHEPLWPFVRRRLAEAARTHLRRHLPRARSVPIAVELPSAEPRRRDFSG
ncbi:methyltransferase [Halostreptopolyspora alba]|uniref:Class I SAM-dependent methyltransferase n=1 Tax=Halostreptopolyspora alba TaxID=2487137 RepID=A0A3N0E5A8_9ACTN|nr:class I SAM-dependent methyltransferase [Nocardiopsaceae bacterium YIM 96095]